MTRANQEILKLSNLALRVALHGAILCLNLIALSGICGPQQTLGSGVVEFVEVGDRGMARQGPTSFMD
jgi:hypothetical protein